MSSQVGYTTTPSGGFFEFGTNTDNQIGALYTMPTPGGLITALHAYCAVYNGFSAASGYLVLWDGSGNVLASVGVTIPASAAWVTATLATPYFVASGSSIFIGWAAPAASGFYAEYNSVSGAAIDYNYDSGTIPGNLGTSHTRVSNEQIGAYADYTPSEAKVWNGTSWVYGAVKVWNGTSWVAGAVKVWNGSSWVSAS